MLSLKIDEKTSAHYNADFSGEFIITQNEISVVEDAEEFLTFIKNFSKLPWEEKNKVFFGGEISVSAKDFSVFAEKINFIVVGMT